MLPGLLNLFGSKAAPSGQAEAPLPPSATAAPGAPVASPATTHVMPNGLIAGAMVQYSLAHAFDGALLTLALEAGPGHSAVTCFPAGHDPAAMPMRSEGDVWVVELPGYKGGDEVEVHFVVERDGEQCDNSTERHRLTLPEVTSAVVVPEAGLEAGTVEAEGAGRHTMPNGLIDGQQVEYTLLHEYDGSALTLRLDAGPGHTSVTAHPAPYEVGAIPMTPEGDAWTVQLQGLESGAELEVHFVIQKEGEQCDNSSARHKISIGGSGPQTAGSAETAGQQ